MEKDTVNRFDRIVAILIQLQSKKIVKAQDLADRFQVSLRTIYRDIRTLEASGVPIISEAGIGYSIMDGYRLPPIMFTREEAGSFVAAEKLMQQFTDKTLGAYYESAMFKVKSVLHGKDKDWVSALEKKVQVNKTQVLFNENIPNALELIFESITERKQIYLKYQALQSDEPTERKVEPVGLFHENNYWYIFAYCHIRNDYRQFRTDRIIEIKRTEINFTLKHGTIEEHRKKREEVVKTKVVILVDRKVARYIKGSSIHYGYISEVVKKDHIEMTFMTTDIEEGFPRWYLMFGDYAKILEPETLKVSVLELLRKTKFKLLN